MREWFGDWAAGLGDEQLAQALLGLGLIKPSGRRRGADAAASLRRTIRGQYVLHSWRLDALPADRSGWPAAVPAAALADVVQEVGKSQVLRVVLFPGSPLPTWSVWDYLRRNLGTSVVLHVAGRAPDRSLRFRWPARVACLPDIDSEVELAGLLAADSWGGNVFTTHVLSRRRPHCDVLMCVAPAMGEALQLLSRGSTSLGGVSADFLLLFDTSALEPVRVDLQYLEALRASVAAGGIAVIAAAKHTPAATARKLLIEISHNQTLDVAVALATSGEALLLTDRRLLAATHLEQKVRNLIGVLNAPAQADRLINVDTFGRWADLGADVEEPRLDWQSARGHGSRGAGADDAGISGDYSADVEDRSAPAAPTALAVAPRPTRKQVGGRLQAQLDHFGWHGESDEASDLGRALKSLSDDDEALAVERFLQVGIGTADEPEVPVERALQPETMYAVSALIGEKRVGYLAANESFPDLAPPDDGRMHDLQVVFWEPRSSPQPQIARLELPPVGASSVCRFELKTGPSGTAVDARITVLHRNRVLQTGRLTAPVDASGRPRFTLDATPRRNLSGLDERLNFSMAFVLNDVEGRGAVHTIAGDEAAVLNIDDSAIDQLVRVIAQAISNITSRPADFDGLRASGSEELLRLLAQKGATLREYLWRHATKGGRLSAPTHLQVVATKPGKIFPAEFLYEYEAPEPDAKVCPHAERALLQGECAAECASRSSALDAMAHTICPLGFWGLRCAIERKAHAPPDNERDGDYALILEPTHEAVRHLRPLSATVVAATPQANRAQPNAVADMMTRLSAVISKSTLVKDWDEWVAAVKASQPTMLTLLVHQEKDAYGTPLLDIGSRPPLSSDLVKAKHVRSPDSTVAPLVLLIGCETGLADISYENVALHFQWHGAALVVSTIAEVLGRQAAPMVAELIEAMNGAKQPVSFAELLRDLRRRLLANGTPMVLALTALGDADWEIVAT